ncbi:hypothetical protein BJ684DRAFT_7463 [Piptocephalis cylindrospora]|uniref:4-coumarate-CoA ligase n=1 Tax=Piptocephalis cylindrospora TaxID=1907219 RepID=A0A4P9YAN1_9FUNG|nr:hypothetical protein BJ684DRAFT_7463 [Piptocephalis cylindrospora]|eukprot:RKP15150.1 hypothetical protein BJ684DRAFT_7463 [Piptocephalis cylindrospora]
MSFTSQIPDIKLQEMDIYHYLFDNPKVASLPEVPALVDGPSGRTVTRGEVGRIARQFAHVLAHQYHWKSEEVAAIISPNSVEYPSLLLGVLAVGGIVTTANPAYSAAEFAKQLKDSGARLILTVPELLPIVVEAAKMASMNPHKDIILVHHPDHPAHTSNTHLPNLYGLLGPEEYAPIRLQPNEIWDRVAYLVYSSGTSGMPKGVQMTHGNIVSNSQQKSACEGPTPKNEVWGGVLPFYHIYGLTIVIHCAFSRGIPVIVFPKFDFTLFLELIVKYRITMSHVAPPICLALAKHPAVPNYDLSSVRSLVSGAAPLDGELAKAVLDRTGIIVRQGYGMSETAPLVTLVPELDFQTGSSGILVPNMEAKIVDPAGRPLGIGEEGELCLKGPNVTRGYWKNPRATAETMDADGFLHTGDVVRRDERGHVYVVDRIKELIKYKGFQVAPAELEALLLTHQEIDDVAVIGIMHPEMATEVPLAYVVRKPQSALTEEEVVAYVASMLAAHKQLRGGVRFIDAIPKSGAGKILRRILRDAAKATTITATSTTSKL